MGFFGDNLLIVYQDLSFKFFKDEQIIRKKCFEILKASQVLVLIENSNLTLFDYAIVKLKKNLNERWCRLQVGEFQI